MLPWLSWFGVTANRDETDTSSGLESLPLELELELLIRLSAEKLFFSSGPPPPLPGGVGVSLAIDEGGYLSGPRPASGGRYFRSCGCDCGCPGSEPANGWCCG